MSNSNEVFLAARLLGGTNEARWHLAAPHARSMHPFANLSQYQGHPPSGGWPPAQGAPRGQVVGFPNAMGGFPPAGGGAAPLGFGPPLSARPLPVPPRPLLAPQMVSAPPFRLVQPQQAPLAPLAPGALRARALPPPPPGVVVLPPPGVVPPPGVDALVSTITQAQAQAARASERVEQVQLKLIEMRVEQDARAQRDAGAAPSSQGDHEANELMFLEEEVLLLEQEVLAKRELLACERKVKTGYHALHQGFLSKWAETN